MPGDKHQSKPAPTPRRPTFPDLWPLLSDLSWGCFPEPRTL